MNKYWYVVQQKKEFYIGFCYGNPEVDELELINSVMDYCKTKNYRLALMMQVFPMMPIVNQIYPSETTAETRMCLEQVLQAINM